MIIHTYCFKINIINWLNQKINDYADNKLIKKSRENFQKLAIIKTKWN